MKYSNALVIATEWLRKLTPYCDRIEIAGSIRRQKQEVKDIELVCVPKEITDTDLFEGARKLRHPGFAQELQNSEVLTVFKGNAHTGKYTQVYLEEHRINMDVFIANPQNYGLIKLIRTGDADFSRKFIGQVLPWFGYRSSEGHLMTEDDDIVPCTEEEQLFDICKIKFIAPENRTVNALP